MLKFGIMLLSTLSAIFLFNFQNVQVTQALGAAPRHVHLSFTSETEMTVTWSTKNRPSSGYVEYGDSSATLKNVKEAKMDKLTSTDKHRSNIQYIHEVTLKNLVPGQTYYYRCGSRSRSGNGEESSLKSKIFKFRQPKTPNLILLGDLGFEDGFSLPFLKEEVETGEWDAMIQFGDMAYNLNKHGGKVGDNFMASIEDVAARVPYQVCPGNHEKDYKRDFNDYKKRFRMGGKFDSLLYSWNLGPVHFIAMNTEYYYELPDGIQAQYDWLQQDLQNANAQRSIRPWIIVYGHRSMYCSTPMSQVHDCTGPNNRVRVGSEDGPGLEDLFFEQGVDLLLWGHEHDYEASFPVYNNTIFNGTAQDPFHNPKAPVHIINGAAGNKDPNGGFDTDYPTPSWCRFRSSDNGYARLRVVNSSNLHYEQISIGAYGNATLGTVMDSFTLIQNNHGPFQTFL